MTDIYEQTDNDYKFLKDPFEPITVRVSFDENTNQVEDNVNHPKHYTSHPSGIECIQITEHFNFCIGNAIKYLWRNGLKDGNSSVQELKKAVWYINREIERVKKFDKSKHEA